MSSHADGSYVHWVVEDGNEPSEETTPYGKLLSYSSLLVRLRLALALRTLWRAEYVFFMIHVQPP